MNEYIKRFTLELPNLYQIQYLHRKTNILLTIQGLTATTGYSILVAFFNLN